MWWVTHADTMQMQLTNESKGAMAEVWTQWGNGSWHINENK